MARLLVSGKVVDRRDLALAIGERSLAGDRFDLRITTPERAADVLAAEAAAEGIPRLVAVGGDGTLHEVVLGALGADEPPVVGFVPCGTANDFAAQFSDGVADLGAWLARALRAPPRWIDVGAMDGEPFVNLATIGVPAEVSAETPPERKEALGKLAYTASALATIGSIRPVALTVRAPDLDYDGEVVAVCVANGRQAGGGFVLAPDADLEDGLLDLVIVPALGLAGLGAVASGALLGGLDLDSRVIRARVPWVEIAVGEGEEPVAISLDGEVVRRERARFTVRPRALAIAV